MAGGAIVFGEVVLVLFLSLWGAAPRPARERGSLDPVLGGVNRRFQTNDGGAWSGANTGFL